MAQATLVDIGRFIESRPEIRRGRPCLAGTGVTVHRVVQCQSTADRARVSGGVSRSGGPRKAVWATRSPVSNIRQIDLDIRRGANQSSQPPRKAAPHRRTPPPDFSGFRRTGKGVIAIGRCLHRTGKRFTGLGQMLRRCGERLGEFLGAFSGPGKAPARCEDPSTGPEYAPNRRPRRSPHRRKVLRLAVLLSPHRGRLDPGPTRSPPVRR